MAFDHYHHVIDYVHCCVHLYPLWLIQSCSFRHKNKKQSLNHIVLIQSIFCFFSYSRIRWHNSIVPCVRWQSLWLPLWRSFVRGLQGKSNKTKKKPYSLNTHKMPWTYKYILSKESTNWFHGSVIDLRIKHSSYHCQPSKLCVSSLNPPLPQLAQCRTRLCHLYTYFLFVWEMKWKKNKINKKQTAGAYLNNRIWRGPMTSIQFQFDDIPFDPLCPCHCPLNQWQYNKTYACVVCVTPHTI